VILKSALCLSHARHVFHGQFKRFHHHITAGSVQAGAFIFASKSINDVGIGISNAIFQEF
jgi:hypothetical protein